MSPCAVQAVLTIQRQRALLKSAILLALQGGETERAADLSGTRDALARIAGEVMT